MARECGIALGTWSWGTGQNGGDAIFGNHKSEAELKAVFDEAMARGLNLWDTAAFYGMGASETMLGTFVRGVPRDSVCLSTKFTPKIASLYDDSMEAMLDSSLARLGVDYVDIYWIHHPDDVDLWTAAAIPLLRAGKVRRVGVSNHNLAQIKRAAQILEEGGQRLFAVQNHYSLLYRSSERAGILDWCHEHDADFFAYMTLEQGSLSGKYSATHPLPPNSQRGRTYNPLMGAIDCLVAEMGPIARAHGVDVAQIPVAWAIAKGTTPIVGVTSPKQADDAAAALHCALTPDEMARLEAAAATIDVDTRGHWEKPMA